MGFFDLDKKWKILIYRIGLFSHCASLIGLVFVGLNSTYHYGEDIIKTKPNPKFNGSLEKLFYITGYFTTAIGLYVILAFLIAG